jgi:hypothetical protein
MIVRMNDLRMGDSLISDEYKKMVFPYSNGL